MANIGMGFNALKNSTNPNIVGAGQAFANSVNQAQQLGNFATQGAGAVGDVAQGVGNVAGNAGKFSKALDAANKFAAPVQAGLGVVSLGFDIANSVEAQKQAREQLDLAKKNFNLELEKAQKQELAYNELAGSIDKAWGGSGKVANTIDYSQYKAGDKNSGGGSLQAGGAGGHYMGSDSNSASATSDMGGSGNMPMGSANTASLVGHSDSIDSGQSASDEEQEQ